MSLTTSLPSRDLVPTLASPHGVPAGTELFQEGQVTEATAVVPVARGPRRHRCMVDEPGCVTHARIVPQSSQNQGAIETDPAACAPSVLDLPHAEAAHRLEMLIRAYDPGVSGATHFLDLRIVVDGAREGTI